MFKTQHLRNQGQIVIILKSFTYFIILKCILNSMTIKCIICKGFKNYDFLLLFSQMPRFNLCIFFIFQLYIFQFLHSIIPFLHFCIFPFLDGFTNQPRCSRILLADVGRVLASATGLCGRRTAGATWQAAPRTFTTQSRPGRLPHLPRRLADNLCFIFVNYNLQAEP